MPERILLCIALIAALAPACATPDDVGFGGVPFLGPGDSLRRLFAPYDLVKLNVLGANYCENLLDMRLNTTSYTHLASDSPVGDAWNLQFPDDAGRFLEAIAWEDQFSPVCRLELARRLVKGMLAARVPGTYSESYFRHRSGGKTFVIFGDRQGRDGRMLLSMWGDEISGSLKVGFRTQRGGVWAGMDAFQHTDPPNGAGDAGQARSPRLWNDSPVIVRRNYTGAGGDVGFTGRYWLSDEDRPLEFGFDAPPADRIQVVVGEPGTPLPLLGDYRLPTTIHLPDRKATFRSDKDGDRTFANPDFPYLILRKTGGAWATTGYSAALIVGWEGKPESVEVIADKGYGEVRVTFAASSGKVWLYPYYWLDDADIQSVFRSAESFVEHGVLLQNGFPSQQLLNAIPAGLAAGAYLLTRYHDPMAVTARINAARAVDRLFAAEDEGKRLVRVFFTVKAAAWMVKVARELSDREMERRYTAFVDRAMRRMCSAETGYDGRAWPGGWDHFNSAKACWLAYGATGNADYLHAYERALSVYTIDERGIYRYGKKLDAPGGFDTYSGSLPLAVWGNAGKLDFVDRLINLAVPNGWHHPETLVRDTWNDAGAGPWAQDDANPEYVGFSLRGAAIPQGRKFILPVGAFPLYDRHGKVTVTRKPILRNPFFLPGDGRTRIVTRGRPLPSTAGTVVALKPGTADEAGHAVNLSGVVSNGLRTCGGGDGPLVYRFDTSGATGVGLDLRIKGEGYRIDVSPDGRRWYNRLDTYDHKMADQSLDLSFLAGSREELVRLDTYRVPGDATLVVDSANSREEAGKRRCSVSGGTFTYRLDLPGVTSCWLELLVGNGYRIDYSADGSTWRTGVRATDMDGVSGKLDAGAGVLRMLNVAPALGRAGRIFVRVTDEGGPDRYSGQTAFVSRIVPYGVLRTGQTWVRLSNVSSRNTFALERVALRTWRGPR